MDFVDQVLLEILAAVGGALFVGNLVALLRHRPAGAGRSDLPRAPVVRTVVYLGLGFVVMAWAVVTIVVS